MTFFTPLDPANDWVDSSDLITVRHILYLNPALETSALSNFFVGTFDRFGKELKHLAETMYNHRHSPWHMFFQTERSWLGVFNNAVMREWPDNSSSLQEFSIYKGEYHFEKYEGRADLLVRWKGVKEVYFLFEAKLCRKTTLEHLHEEPISYYDKIAQQARKYYKAEGNYYKGRETYLVTLTFHEIHDEFKLCQAIERFNKLKKIHRQEDFCSLYYLQETFNTGLLVYGKVYSTSSNSFTDIAK